MKLNKNKTLGLLLFLIACLIYIIIKVEIPFNTELMRAIQNAMHIPVFGILSLLLLQVSKVYYRDKFQIQSHYIIACTITIFIGFLLELSQVISHRDADFIDLVRDFLGALSFLIFYATLIDKKIKSNKRWKIIASKSTCIIMLILLLIGFSPVMMWSIAQRYRDNHFPQVGNFDSYWESMYWKSSNSKISIVDRSKNWIENDSDKVLEIEFQVARNPKFSIIEPSPDWSGYTYFTCTIYSELTEDRNITIRIDDKSHNGDLNDRFNQTIKVSKGVNFVKIPIERIESAPFNRKMNLIQICSIILFSYDNKKEFSIQIDNMRLE